VTDYTPTHAGTVTRYVVIESFDVTPADLAIRAYEIAQGALIKETCFGLVINGKEGEVDRIIEELRKIDPDHIFVKDRGFPPGDPRRCRANLGGARPGFFGMEFEMGILPYISHGLARLRQGGGEAVPPPPVAAARPGLDVDKLKKLIEAQEP
jgi:putative methanogenesis marker protein 6